jgi:hypothetical protein
MMNFAQIGILLSSSGFHPYYEAILARASSLGYTLPSGSQQSLQNALVVTLVNSGIWAELDLFHVFATDGDSDFATLNWISPSLYQAVKVSSPTFNVDEGFQSNGTSSYVRSGWVPSTDAVQFTTNDSSFGAWVHTGGDAGATAKTLIGSLSATNNNILLADASSGNVSSRLNQGSSGLNTFTGTAQFESGKSYAVDRTASNSGNQYVNGVSVSTFSTASSGLSNIAPGFLARNTNTSPDIFGLSSWKLSIVFFGSSSISQSSLHSAMSAYMTSI